MKLRDYLSVLNAELLSQKTTTAFGATNAGDYGQKVADGNGMLPIWARDWRSEKSNITDNARPLSEVVGGLMPSLRANKWGARDSHGNVQAWSGLKLTSNFCEAFQGFPQNWTLIDEPESTPSATRSSLRKSFQSSKP